MRTWNHVLVSGERRLAAHYAAVTVYAHCRKTKQRAETRGTPHFQKSNFGARAKFRHKFWEECRRSQPHGHMWSVTPYLSPLPHHRAPLPSSHSTGRSLRLAQCASVSDVRVELRIRWCPSSSLPPVLAVVVCVLSLPSGPAGPDR